MARDAATSSRSRRRGAIRLRVQCVVCIYSRRTGEAWPFFSSSQRSFFASLVGAIAALSSRSASVRLYLPR